MEHEVIPVTMGVLGIPLEKSALGESGIETKIVDLQKTAVLYSIRIL